MQVSSLMMGDSQQKSVKPRVVDGWLLLLPTPSQMATPTALLVTGPMSNVNIKVSFLITNELLEA